LGHKEVTVTRLRKLMLDELQRRNYAQNTVRAYIHAIEDFAKYFHRSPDRLGPERIREYQVHLFRDIYRKKLMSAIIQANPVEKLLQEPLPTGDSCVPVIFGASGDLTKRKLIPGLYNRIECPRSCSC
jgi:hypothetical protein